MNEPTHKIVNGVRLELTPEEINQTKESWQKEDAKRSERMILRKQKRLAKISLQQKLTALGLTEEEINILKM